MIEVFTDKQAAIICQVEPITIRKWIVNGRLRGHQAPMGDYHVPREHLIRFLKEHGMDAMLGHPLITGEGD